MSAELVGILSVGATLIVGGLATAGAVVGLIFKIEGRLSARLDRLSARLDGRMDRLSARMDTFETRQYEIMQIVVRLEATQQTVLDALGRIEERTRSAGSPPAQPTIFDTGSSPADGPRPSAPASAPTPA